jgi:hypothetical protein
MPAPPELGPGGRIVAALIAAAWLGAGAAAIAWGIRGRGWLAPALGVCALAYGALWVQVARTGHRIEWPRRRR